MCKFLLGVLTGMAGFTAVGIIVARDAAAKAGIQEIWNKNNEQNS